MSGIAIGGMQWLVLRRQVSWAGWWVLANIAGWVVGALLNLPFGLFVGFAVGLAAAGVMQWLVLRRQLSRATWWLLASFVAWAAGQVISGLAFPVCQAPCSGAVIGAITGIALAWLLRHPALPGGEAEEA